MKVGYLKVFCDGENCADEIELQLNTAENHRDFNPTQATHRLKKHFEWVSDGDLDYCRTCAARNAMKGGDTNG